MNKFRYLKRSVATVTLVLMPGSLVIADPPPGFIDASTFGYNTIDATAALQAAIDSGSNVYVPNMGSDWIVAPIHLTQSNQEILFESGVTIAAKQGEFMGTDDSLFRAARVSNVKMTGYGATFRMRKSDYVQSPYPDGEWRMGILLQSVDGFDIRGMRIEDTGGDGIYIGSSSPSEFSNDVVIKDVVLNNNLRQGISVISARNVLIDNAIISVTNGKYPASGIDFEPNFATQRIENVTVRNSIIQANDNWGILFATGNNELPLSVTVENVTILNNGRDGIKLTEIEPGVTIKDSLLINNAEYGLRGAPVTGELILGEILGTAPDRNSIDYSVLSGNVDGSRTGWTELGPGTAVNIDPIFYSMDPSDPYFLYLDPSNPLEILQGASDGGYVGARPVYAIPEPGSAMLFSGIILLPFIYRRRANPC